jgi:nucleoid-associated protein YgaU
MLIHTVKDGDTLQSVAFQAYGDPTRWRDVAIANDIDNPFEVPRGTNIALPKFEV